MSDNMATGIVTIVLGIIGVASLAVIFSRSANTSGVIQAGGNALAQDIGAAVSPITGGNAIGANSFATPAALTSLGGSSYV